MKTLFFKLPGLLAAACVCCSGAAPPQLSQDGDTVLATLNGEPIREKDLNISAKLTQLQQEAYQARLDALDELIADRLIEKAAAKKNMNKAEFLRHELKSEDPTEEELRAFYEAQKSRINKPFEEVREQAAKFLKRMNDDKGRGDLVDRLRKGADVAVRLTAPRIRMNVKNSPRRGPAGSQVTIVEYSDYQCPYCRRVQPTLLEVLDKYGDKVSLVYKDLPLKQIHPQAQKAAEAARCAGDQGKFWEYHDKLFALSHIRKSDLPTIAEELELNTLSFGSCLDSGKYESRVDADLEEAVDLGVNSTPVFFVNGIQLRGALPLSSFSRAIDAELASSRPAGQ